jgi:hypothetical protein
MALSRNVEKKMRIQGFGRSAHIAPGNSNVRCDARLPGKPHHTTAAQCARFYPALLFGVDFVRVFAIAISPS